MKRLWILFFSVMLLLSMFGCTQEQGDPVNNKVFTNEFFEDVTDIRLSFKDEPLTDQQLAAVIRCLKSLRLTHTEKELPTERPRGTYGGSPLEKVHFIKADGTTLEIRVNQWAMSGLPGGSYYMTDYEEAMERGEKNILRSLWVASGGDPDATPFFF